MKSRMVAVLFALFGGVIGLHYFYLNKTGIGMIHLMFSFTGIPMFLGWFYAIKLLMMSDKTFIKKYDIISGQQVQYK